MSLESRDRQESFNRFSLDELSCFSLKEIVEHSFRAETVAKIIKIAIKRSFENEFDTEAAELLLVAVEQQKAVFKQDLAFEIMTGTFEVPATAEQIEAEEARISLFKPLGE